MYSSAVSPLSWFLRLNRAFVYHVLADVKELVELGKDQIVLLAIVFRCVGRGEHGLRFLP